MTTTLRADAARNRQRVLATARAAVAEGDLSLQLNEIARRAGVGVGTVYRHFPTRRALLEALAADAFATLLDQARAATHEDDPWDGVELLLRAFLRGQLDDPALAEVLATPAEQDATTPTTAGRAELGALAATVLEQATRAGRLRPGLTLDDLQHLVCGTAFAARIAGTPRHRDELYLTVLLAGIRAADPGEGSRPAD
ncbi:TetR/AcrR family transcriptional regulator [Micromonospora rifamycinica]|uniref:TetR/AcrR family transcriptional regulator n=1 Tax=Micromonospora rifamycinica TaxID=291594 RepID=UPI002E2D4C3E|nr:TetR/AcrR family transcriptional regulator [Micromonospora rifamycinica]